MSSPTNQEATAKELQKKLCEPGFRRSLSGSADPMAAAKAGGIAVGELPAGLVDALAQLTEDELNTLASCNAKLETLGFINGGAVGIINF